MIGYNLDENGRIVLVGLLSQADFEFEVTDGPFNTIEEAVDWRKDLINNTWIFDPIIMIESISKLQAVSRLIDTGRYNDLMTALDTDETGVKRILFDAAHQLDRDSSMVNEMALALGFTSEDTDAFFTEASKILV